MDKISIIVPVYNVEPYLQKCLDSIINQTHTNLEILCINDGSEDRGGFICDEYAKRDSRIKVFHQANRGLSSALNEGLKNATGYYFGFVDSDDWIEPDMYETLYTAIRCDDVQISIAGYFKDIGTESIPMRNKIPIPEGVIPTRDMLLYPLKRDDYLGFCGYVWNKLYTAEMLKKSGLSFDENIKYGMDVLFYTSIVLAENCKGVYIDKSVYHYLQRAAAITKSTSYAIKYDILAVYKRVEELLIENGYAEDAFWARGFNCHHASVIAELAIQNNDMDVLLAMRKIINDYCDDYIATNQKYPEKFERMNRLRNG